MQTGRISHLQGSLEVSPPEELIFIHVVAHGEPNDSPDGREGNVHIPPGRCLRVTNGFHTTNATTKKTITIEEAFFLIKVKQLSI